MIFNKGRIFLPSDIGLIFLENKIIYISTDTNKEKEYLFSTSIYTTVTELHDIEGNRSLYWNTTSFWQICEIFSYEINILDLPENGENHYLCAFTQHENHKRMFNGKMYDYSTTFSLRKFKFDTFGSFSILGTKVNYTSNYNSRMISTFIVYDMEIIVVFFYDLLSMFLICPLFVFSIKSAIS